MEATTNTEIFAFESNINQAFREWFTDQGIEVFDKSSADTPPNDYVGISTEIGAATGHYTAFTDGQFAFDQYSFTVTFTITARRFNDASDDAEEIDTLLHSLMAQVRATVSYKIARGSDLEGFLEFYAINTFMPSGTSIDQAADKDVCELSYEGQFTIKPGAWPTN